MKKDKVKGKEEKEEEGKNEKYKKSAVLQK